MIYLGSLNNAATLRNIIKNHNPSLIYFICHVGNSERFPLDSRINDRERDCRALDTLNITQFKRPKHIHEGLCNLTRFGIVIFNELREYEICNKISEILNKRDENSNALCTNLDDYIRLFNEEFSVEIEPANRIEERRENIKNRLFINIAPNNHEIIKGNNTIRIEYYLHNEILCCRLHINCRCSEEWVEDLGDIEDSIASYRTFELECRNCGNQIFVNSTFYH